MKHIYINKLFKSSIVLLIIVCSVIGLKYAFHYIYPFLIAIILAIILDPLVTKIENRGKIPRGLATLVVMTGFFSVVFIAGFFITNRMMKELKGFVDQLPIKLEQFKSILLSLGQSIYDSLVSVFPYLHYGNIEKEIDNLIDHISTYSLELLKNILLSTSNTLSSLSYLALVIVFITLAVYMMTKDMPLFKRFALALIPTNISMYFSPVMNYMKRSIMGLIKAQLFMTTISTIIICICLILFQVDHVLLITTIIFFIDFIPYVGIGLIFVPWIFFLFFTEQYVLTIELALLYTGILLLRQMIEPKLIASEIGIHPFIALSILFIGVQMLGIIGIFITPVVLICVSAFYRAGVFHAIWQYINAK